jgi:hypothetical protein
VVVFRTTKEPGVDLDHDELRRSSLVDIAARDGMPSRVMLRPLLIASFGAAIACSAAAESGSAESAMLESPDAGTPGICASSFGDQLTPGFGRIDGTVYAVQKPSDTQCTLPNSDHVIVQVLMNGAVYRLVTNVKSDRPAPDGGGDARVQMLAVDHVPLPAPAFAEGWHTGDDVWIDYVRHFNVHAEEFTPQDMDPLVQDIAARIHVGDPISIYAQSGEGRPDSAHLVHRNGHGKDGAIVLNPTTDPTYLLFLFAEQRF